MPKQNQVNIRPIITLVCDDVRIENNNKPFLIGLYLGGMTLSGVIPEDKDDVSNLQVYLWMPFESMEAGHASFEIKLVMPNPKHQVRMKGKAIIQKNSNDPENAPLVLGPIPLKLWETGTLQILFKNDGEADYQTLRTIPVTFNSIQEVPSTEIEQLS